MPREPLLLAQEESQWSYPDEIIRQRPLKKREIPLQFSGGPALRELLYRYFGVV